MDRYFMPEGITILMPAAVKFLNIRLRAFAQATEIEERILTAMTFAAGTDGISVTRTEGHFGNPITIFGAELEKSGEMRPFLERLAQAGILAHLAGQEDARVDDDCAFHFRLDKQKAYLGELALATNRDIIDVRMKVAAYPAKRENAVRAVSDWLSKQED